MIDYLQPSFRLYIWAILVYVLNLLLNLVIPFLLGISVFGDIGETRSVIESRSRLQLLSGRQLLAGVASVGILQWILWLLGELLPLRTTVCTEDIFLSYLVIYVIVSPVSIKEDHPQLMWQITFILSALRPTSIMSYFRYIWYWSRLRAALGCVVMGTGVAAVLGGFAAVNFPLEVVYKYFCLMSYFVLFPQAKLCDSIW